VLVETTVASRSWRAKLLALALLVTWVLADDHDSTVTANYLALVANLLNAWVNLHVLTTSLRA